MLAPGLLVCGWLLAVLCVAVTTLVDLVRRPVRVAWWWGTPALLAFFVGQIGWLAALVHDVELPLVSAVFQAAVLLGTTVALALSAGGLAVARGIRPGGDRGRLSRSGALGLPVLFVFAVLPGLVVVVGETVARPWRLGGMSPLAAMAMLPWTFTLAWWLVFAPTTILVLLALERDGAERVTVARPHAFGWLGAAVVLFWTAGLHLVVAGQELGGSSLGDVPLLAVASACAAMFTTLVPFALVRWLGPVAKGPIALSASAVLSLAAPAVGYAVWTPLETGVTVPAHVDVRGRYRFPERFGMFDCLDEPGAGTSCGGTLLSNPVQVLPADHPLDVAYSSFPIAVDRGRGLVRASMSPDSSCVMLVADGDRVRLDGRAEPIPWGASLHDALQRPDTTVCVKKAAGWTLQHFVSICASLPASSTCRLVP